MRHLFPGSPKAEHGRLVLRDGARESDKGSQGADEEDLGVALNLDRGMKDDDRVLWWVALVLTPLRVVDDEHMRLCDE